MVKKKLLKLKMNKALAIETRILLELETEISVTAAELFTKFLKSGDVPQDWKMANLTAVYK